LRVFQDRELRKIFGPKGEEVLETEADIRTTVWRQKPT
jgi:hypothetical protein